MTTIKKIGRWIADFTEVWLPIAIFVLLFIVFLINIIARYVFKSPINWTFEASINSFVILGLVGSCTAYRQEDHVVFDLLYVNASLKGKNIYRILTHLLVFIFFLIALPASIKYVFTLPAVTSILKIPLKIIFSSYLILMVSTILRSGYRLYQDIRSLIDKTYDQKYNTEEKDVLI